MEENKIQNRSQQEGNLLKVRQVQDVNDLKRRALTLGFYGAAGFLGYKFLLAPALAKMRKNREQSSMISDPNKRQATVLYNAMNPSGITWMRAMDKTNEDMIYGAARKITNWNAVQTTYRNLYNRDLLSDLQSELDTKEYQTFLKILSQGNQGNSAQTQSQTGGLTGVLIAASKNIRIRSTPDSSKGTFSLDSNILTTATTGSFLGWATGKVTVDNQGVKYLQVKIQFSEGIPKGFFTQLYQKLGSKTMTFWVGAGAIDQFRHYQKMFDHGVKLYKGVSDMGLRQGFK
jgi:hypothetical protein